MRQAESNLFKCRLMCSFFPLKCFLPRSYLTTVASLQDFAMCDVLWARFMLKLNVCSFFVESLHSVIDLYTCVSVSVL